jgi:hypothetical protein
MADRRNSSVKSSGLRPGPESLTETKIYTGFGSDQSKTPAPVGAGGTQVPSAAAVGETSRVTTIRLFEVDMSVNLIAFDSLNIIE